MERRFVVLRSRGPLLLWTTLALIAACAAAVLWTGWRLSRPVPQRVGLPPRDLNAEAVEFQTESGSRVHGWFLRRNAERGVILLLPPVRANRLAMLPRARFLYEAGYSTLLIDFQATGETPGEAITFGWRERQDVIAAVRFLNQRISGERVGVLGISLGGAAALLATPPLHVDAIVLEAVYPSIEAAVENRLRMRLGSVGALLAPLLVWQLEPRLGVKANQLRPLDRIAAIRCPVLVIGGVEDRHTTEIETRSLYASALEPKQLWLIPATAHVDFFEAAGAEYRRRVLEFFGSALNHGGPAKVTS